MKNRRFGIEIECGFNRGQDRQASINECRGLLTDAGRKGDIDPYWGQHMGTDGTLIEARSPILAGREGFKEVHRVMNLLRSNGGYVTQSDGMHVHHDAPEFVNDVDAVIRLVKSWVENRHIIERFVARNRHTSAATPHWPETEVKRLEKFTLPLDERIRALNVRKGGSAYYGPNEYVDRNGYRVQIEDFKQVGWNRRDLNIAALQEHGSIEIRLHEGCLDPVRAEAWLKFGQAFLNSVANRKNPIPRIKGAQYRRNAHEILLQRISATKFARENLALVS